MSHGLLQSTGAAHIFGTLAHLVCNVQGLYRHEPVVEDVPIALAVHRDEKETESVPEEGRMFERGREGSGIGLEERKRGGVMEAQLSVPQVVNVNVTHAMVSAISRKASALSEVNHESRKNNLLGNYDSFIW